MSRALVVVGLLFLSAAPAFAQDATTLQNMLSKGVVIHATSRQGQPLEMQVTYKADGTSAMTVMGRDLSGKWRIDGDKFCTVNAMNPVEACFDIPPGKKPGDEFKVTTPALGEVTMTINQ